MDSREAVMTPLTEALAKVLVRLGDADSLAELLASFFD